MKYLYLLQGISLLAGLSVASPVPAGGDNKPHHIPPKSPDVIVKNDKKITEIKSRVMRFGIELEQFVDIPNEGRFGKAFHSAAASEIAQKGVTRLTHPEVVDLLGEMLAKEWASWNERKDLAFFNHNKWTRRSYRKHGLCNAVKEDNNCNVLQEWTVVLDTSLSSSSEEIASLSKVGVEFVSPIMYVGPDDFWYKPARYSIEMFYWFLTERCGLRLVQDRPGWVSGDLNLPRTSTHIHVSPPTMGTKEENDPEEWTLTRAQQMGESTVFWEPAIRALLPKDRWANSFAREFRDSHFVNDWKVKGFGDNNGAQGSKEALTSVLGKIAATETMGDLKDLMNPGDFPDFKRQCGWNFLNLPNTVKENKKGSIEFRRGGQSMNASDAARYLELVTGLALAACRSGNTLMEDFHDGQKLSVGELYDFINSAISNPPDLTEGVQMSAFQEGWVYPELAKTFDVLMKGRSVDNFKIFKYPPRLDVEGFEDEDGSIVVREDFSPLVPAMSNPLQLSPNKAMSPQND